MLAPAPKTTARSFGRTAETAETAETGATKARHRVSSDA